jgi:hypothetical protein
MKSYKQIALGLALVTIIAADAQRNAFSRGFPSANQVAMTSIYNNSQLTTQELTEPKNIDGDPFLFENYVPAEVTFVGTDKEAIQLSLNYNIYADLMKMENSEDKNGEVRILPKASNFDILMNNKRFRYIDFNHNKKHIESYVEILESFESGGFLALHRTKVIQKIGRKFQEKTTFYYIGANGSSIKLENNKQNVTKEMSGKAENMVKNYIKEKNIKFDDDLRALKGVARYYSSVL